MISDPKVELTTTGVRLSFMASSKEDADRFSAIFHRRLLESGANSQMQHGTKIALLGEPKGLLGGLK